MSPKSTMVRRQIYLTVYETKALALIARRTGLSVSELIRRAVDTSIKEFAKANKP